MGVETMAMNAYGLKDSTNCYLHVNGQKYEQWTDVATKEDCQAVIEQDTKDLGGQYLFRKINAGGFYRVYRKAE